MKVLQWIDGNNCVCHFERTLLSQHQSQYWMLPLCDASPPLPLPSQLSHTFFQPLYSSSQAALSLGDTDYALKLCGKAIDLEHGIPSPHTAFVLGSMCLPPPLPSQHSYISFQAMCISLWVVLLRLFGGTQQW